MGVFGDTLRQARAHKGITLREAEVATRIKRHWLLALEEEHFDELPALIYQRGIVRNYASYLSLDPAKLLVLFGEAKGSPVDEAPAVMATPQMVATPGSFVPNFAVIAFVLVAMSAAFVWGYSAYFGGADAGNNGVSAIPTATALGDEERFIATSTAIPPTPQPTVEPTRKPTSAPTSDTSADTGSNSSVSIGQDQENVVEAPTEAGATVDSGNNGSIDAENTQDVSYSFYTDVDVDLLVVVDNNIAWNTTLFAGQSTGYLTGKSFVVSLTGASSIIVIDGSSNAETINATEFTLP